VIRNCYLWLLVNAVSVVICHSIYHNLMMTFYSLIHHTVSFIVKFRVSVRLNFEVIGMLCVSEPHQTLRIVEDTDLIGQQPTGSTLVSSSQSGDTEPCDLLDEVLMQ